MAKDLLTGWLFPITRGPFMKQLRAEDFPVPVPPPLRALGGSRGGWVAMSLVTAVIYFITSSAIAEDPGEMDRMKEHREKLKEQSRWSEAIAVAEKILDLSREKYGEQHAQTAEAMYGLAWLINCVGKREKAVELWTQALENQERVLGKDSVEAARTLRMLGIVRCIQLDTRTGVAFLERALSILEAKPGGNELDIGKVLEPLANGYNQLDEWEKAESVRLRAIHLLERSGAEAEMDLSRALSALGRLYSAVGDPDKAEPLIARAVRLREKLFGPDRAETAEALFELAEVYRTKGDFKNAEPLYRRSLEIQEKNFEAYEQQKLFDVLYKFGVMYLDQGRPEQAEPLLKRAVNVVTNHWGENRKPPAALTALGRLYEAKGDYQQARQSYARAHEMLKAYLGPLSRWTILSLWNRARIDYRLGRSQDALACADMIQDGGEQSLREILSFTSERQRLAHQQSDGTGVFGNLWATLGAPGPVARAILRTKGIVLDSLLEDRLLARASENSDMRELVRQLNQARRRLAQLGSFSLSNQSRATESQFAEMESVTAKVESLEASLARRIAGLGRARRALTVRVEEVQSALPKEAVLLEVLRYRHYLETHGMEDSYGLLMLAHRGPPQWIRLGPAVAIDTKVKLYQHLMRNPGQGDSPTQLLRELHEQLWIPVERSLPAGTKQIVLSPDSELNFLSFATLLTPAGRFLAEDYDLAYVSSGRDLLAEDTSRPNRTDLLVWANPDFGLSFNHDSPYPGEVLASRAGSLRELRGLSFHPLPGAEKEGKLLRERGTELGFSEVVVHFGKDATEAELARVQSPCILHLATHGFVLPKPEKADSEPGAGEAEDWAVARSLTFSNPMLRSGLALAGAQHTLRAWTRGEGVAPDNDGIVTAEEIGCLNLRGTRLVVLSACDTGSGEARSGEGVLGLRRGFIQAGARNLLMTLWPIDDEKTADIIADFYQAEHETGNAVLALARVQRGWLTKLRTEKGAAYACRIAGGFILSFQGSPFSRSLAIAR